MFVDDLKDAKLDDFAFSIDFNRWEEVLLKKWDFNSMNKLFQELKKLYTQPQQLGLF
jgi:hypothetical protein